MSTNQSTTPRKEPDRIRAKTETNRSFIVEASAGTGKTRTLVDRILRLVLDAGPKGPPLRLQEICAITFTEKAAGEMKLRLRNHFQDVLSGPEQDDEREERARQALYDLESAAISTFHSFAVSLLKERPVEACLDPRFTALDETQSELFFRRIWEPWIGEALEARHPVLEKALRYGFRLGTLENLARTLRSKWLTVRDLECDPPPAEEEFSERAVALLDQGEPYTQELLKPEDKLGVVLKDALSWLKRPENDEMMVRKAGNLGAAGNWREGKETVRAVREFIGAVVELQGEWRSLPGRKMLYEIVNWLREDFMLSEWEARKRAEGLLDFDDQLRLACELLQNSPAVRRECLAQYKTLLVDEFQDTDSIQWRICLLLSSPDLKGTDPVRLKPEAGRLFVVGDPKQSIYRFRNADIETYLEIVDDRQQEFLGMEKLKLTTNFRSVPSILRFVDAAFAGVMNARRYQQEYLPFGDDGDRKGSSGAPAVHLLGDSFEEEGAKKSSREFLELESARIAGLIRTMHGSNKWKVHDPAAGGDGWRAPQYGDMAVLLPVLTHASILEEALRELDIPYVLEGGKFYYARSEVASAITALRSVANPNDRVALYGALRSIFFGFSDEELLRAHMEGQVLDYRVPAAGSFMVRAFDILLDLHLNRHLRRASETFEILLERTGAREVLAARGFQSLANLNKLGRTLRALQGDTTFSQVVELLAMMDEERLAESESRLMEEHSNAVRVLSVHKAKGLDFPIVFAAAFGVQRKGRTDNLLSDPHGKKVFALNIPSLEQPLDTKNWKDLLEEEKEKEEAELVRLLYVALTRARDHMILSTHTAGWKETEAKGIWMPDVQRTRLKPLGPFLENCYSGVYKEFQWSDTEALKAAEKKEQPAAVATMPDLHSLLEREYEELRTWRRAASASSEKDGEDGEAPDAETAGRRSVRLGLAFHEAMERSDLSVPKPESRIVSELAAQYSLDPGGRILLGDMLQATMSSDLMGRVAQALLSGRRVLKELPYVRMLDDGTVEEGKIDLLFEEENGWTLADYKTDRVDVKPAELEAFLRDKYADQIRGYVDALKDISLQVSAAFILLARTGQSIQIV